MLFKLCQTNPFRWLQYAKNLFYDSKEYYTAYYRYLFLEKVGTLIFIQ